MFSTILAIIVVPATFAFILGFIAHFFKTQAESKAEPPALLEISEVATPAPVVES